MPLLGSVLSWVTGLGGRAREPDTQLLLLGLDSAGKTTLLYTLTCKDVDTTIPTIGFNVETVSCRGVSFRAWDVGGCDKIRPLWRHYTKDLDALIFVVDASDSERGRMDAARDELRLFLNDNEGSIGPVLVFANKQDLRAAALPGAVLTAEEVAQQLQLPDVARGREWHVAPSSFTTQEGIDEGFDWLNSALLRFKRQQQQRQQQRQQQEHWGWATLPGRRPRSGSTARPAIPPLPGQQRRHPRTTSPGQGADESLGQAGSSSASAPEAAASAPAASTTAAGLVATPPGQAPAASHGPMDEQAARKARAADRLQEWLSTPEDPQDTDERFLAALESCTLERWDHYAHLRLAWAYLVRHGRREGKARVFAAIQRYIAHNTAQQQRRSTFHETMTYFWLHMVHYGLASTEAAQPQVRTDFRAFLAANPQLADGGLFLEYYTHSRILHNPEARTHVLLPDVAPLPSLVSDVTAMKRQQGSKVGTSPAAAAAAAAIVGSSSSSGSDDDLLAAVVADQDGCGAGAGGGSAASSGLTGWSGTTLTRLAYAAIKRYGYKGALDRLAAACASNRGLLLGADSEVVEQAVAQVAQQVALRLQGDAPAPAQRGGGPAMAAPGKAKVLPAAPAPAVQGEDGWVVQPFKGLDAKAAQLGGGGGVATGEGGLVQRHGRAMWNDDALEARVGAVCLVQLAALPEYAAFAAPGRARAGVGGRR